MSPMFSLHSGPTLPLSVPDINAFFSHFGVIMFFWALLLVGFRIHNFYELF